MRLIAMLASRMPLALSFVCVAQTQPQATPTSTVIVAGSAYTMRGPAQEAAPWATDADIRLRDQDQHPRPRASEANRKRMAQQHSRRVS